MKIEYEILKFIQDNLSLSKTVRVGPIVNGSKDVDIDINLVLRGKVISTITIEL